MNKNLIQRLYYSDFSKNKKLGTPLPFKNPGYAPGTGILTKRSLVRFSFQRKNCTIFLFFNGLKKFKKFKNILKI